ncbi:RNA recognition motif 2-domain-containing protein [Dichotomocladium elegans]|nr:RNA recognition motif 2-domain-containing protein [Dichotomocladium elegans]
MPRSPNCTTSSVCRDTESSYTRQKEATLEVRAPHVLEGPLPQPQRLSENPSVDSKRSTLVVTAGAHLEQQVKHAGQLQKLRRALGDRTNKVAVVSDSHLKYPSMGFDYTAKSSLLSVEKREPRQQQKESMAFASATVPAVPIVRDRASCPPFSKRVQNVAVSPRVVTEPCPFRRLPNADKAVPISYSSSTFDPFGSCDLFGLHSPSSVGGSTEVDAATPHLHITKIPLDQDSRVIVDTLKRFGDIKNVYEERFHLDHQLTVSFYDVRHTVLARRSLNDITGLQLHTVGANYMSDSLLASRYNVSLEDSRASATILVTMFGFRDHLAMFDYKAFFMKWGDIRTDVQLELSEFRRTVQIEYFDRRCAPLAIANIHGQSFMNIHFHISVNAAARSGNMTRHQPLELSLNILDKDRASTPSASIVLPFEGYPTLLKQPVQREPLCIDQCSTEVFCSAPQPRRLYSPSISSADGFVGLHSSLTEPYSAAQIPPPSTTVVSTRTCSGRAQKGHRNTTSTEQTCYQASLRPSSDPDSADTQSSEDDEKMMSSSSTATFVTAPSVSPREDSQAWSTIASHPARADNEFKLERILDGTDTRTTFMIRNIPNKYTQAMLRECIDATNKGTYDFLYLRIDFQNKCNVGYAFINFIDVKSVASFARERLGKRWNRFNSEKRCSLSYANIQGKMALMEKFRNSAVMEEDESYRPKIFYSDGPMKGEEEASSHDCDRTWRSRKRTSNMQQ